MKVEFLTSDIVRKPESLLHRFVMPGRFNPLNSNQCRLLRYVNMVYKQPISLEISRWELYRGEEVPFDELQRRLRSIQKENDTRIPNHIDTVYVTEAKSFFKKAQLFFPVTFIVGGDLFNKICNPIFYPDREMMKADFRYFCDTNTRFLVMNYCDVHLDQGLLPSDAFDVVEYKELRI